MAKAPTPEKIIIEARKCFGLPAGQTKTINKFANRQMLMDKQYEKLGEFFAEILQSIGIKDNINDPFGVSDAFSNLRDLYSFEIALEQKLYSYNASKQQITWFLLGYSYMPGIARIVANWHLDGFHSRDMPNTLWYFPQIKNKEGATAVTLPVENVIDWLLDLLDKPLDKVMDDFSTQNIRVDAESIKRTLYNWKAASRLPNVSTINQHFADGIELSFEGLYSLDNSQSLEKQCQHALHFLREAKNLDDEGIRDQLRMVDFRLDRVLSNTANDDDKNLFIETVTARYSQPSMANIRQRLLIARAVQDAYVKLLKWMFPDVSPYEPSPEKNKLHQLFAIYRRVHNLTIEATKQCGKDEEKEKQWFFDNLTIIEKDQLYLSILGFQYGESNVDLFAQLLHDIFYHIEPNEFEDHILLPPIHEEKKIIAYASKKLDRDKNIHQEQEEYVALFSKLKTGKAPWKILRNCYNHKAIKALYNDDLPFKINNLRVKRLKELGVNNSEANLYALMEELALTLNKNLFRDKNTKQKVEELLAEAEEHIDYPQWEAFFLQLKARHYLACNEFGGSNGLAEKYFREALKASDSYNHGSLQGEIARDLYALLVTTSKFNENNLAPYFFKMIYGGMFNENDSSTSNMFMTMETIIPSMNNYFWGDLYKPYYGYDNKKPHSMNEAQFNKLLDLIINDEWHNINIKELSKSRIIEGGKNGTILSELAKIHSSLLRDVQNDSALHLSKKAIKGIIDRCPELVNHADFKKQTALMLIMDTSDTEMAQWLIDAGADINAQDFHGRTALHGACFSRAAKSAKFLLSQDNIDLSLKTFVPNYEIGTQGFAGQTVLYTAVRFGLPHIVHLLLERSPELLNQLDDTQQTPLDLAHLMFEGVIKNDTIINGIERKRLGSAQEYQQTIDMLKQAA